MIITHNHLQVLIGVLQRAPISLAEQMIVQETLNSLADIVKAAQPQSEEQGGQADTPAEGS